MGLAPGKFGRFESFSFPSMCAFPSGVKGLSEIWIAEPLVIAWYEEGRLQKGEQTSRWPCTGTLDLPY